MKKILKLYNNQKYRDLFVDLFLPFSVAKFYLGVIYANTRNLTEAKKVFYLLLMAILQYIFIIPILVYNYSSLRIRLPRILEKKKVFNGEIKKVGLYCPYFDIFAGGGEKVSAHVADILERKFPDAYIEIILDDFNMYKVNEIMTLEQVNNKYGTSLKKTVFKMYDHGYLKMPFFRFEESFINTSQQFDLFINLTMNSYPGFGAINIHYYHFPVKTVKDKYFQELYSTAYDSYVANSEFTNKWQKEIFGTENNVVIYPPVIVDRYNKSIQKKNIIMSAGRICESKNYDKMIVFFQNNEHLLEDYEFHIVGTLNPNAYYYYDYLQSLIVSDKIKFFKNISYEEMCLRYGESKIYWHSMGYGVDYEATPGMLEHFGITIVEAMSHGCVPVVFAGGGPAEIVANGHCGFVWKNESELIESTSFLIKNPDSLSKLSEKSIAASQQYSHEVFESEMSKLIDKLIEEKL
ncbi:hypothetical protein MASR1M45_18720 [Candidatus Kapaibacterium sp.]